MDNKSSFDRELILPILLGGLSVIGIGVVFLWGGLSNARQTVPAPDTETPVRFVYLGTEPGLSTLTPEATNTPVPTATEFVIPTNDGVSPTNTSTSIVLPTGLPPRTATPTPSATISSVLSKIDDDNFALLYDGDWEFQTNVTGTYQNTLHISFTVGNSVSYTFTGQQIIVSYQSGSSLGRIGITLDGFTFEIDQSSSATEIVDWKSAVLVRGTHTITITHISGGSVNLDSITIPDVSTPTPTATATETSPP